MESRRMTGNLKLPTTFGELLFCKTAFQRIEIIPTEALTSPLDEAKIDLEYLKKLFFGSYEEELPEHLKPEVALGNALELANKYKNIPKDSIYLSKRLDSEKNPRLDIGFRHSDYMIVPAGWDAAYNGIFNFFYKSESPILRVVDPAISIWNNKDNAVMDFSLCHGFDGDEKIINNPKVFYGSPFYDGELESSLKEVLGEQKIIEVRGLGQLEITGYKTKSVPTDNIHDLMDYILFYFKR